MYDDQFLINSCMIVSATNFSKKKPWCYRVVSLQRFGGGAKSIKFDDAFESSKFGGFPIHVKIGNTETTAVWSDDVCMF